LSALILGHLFRSSSLSSFFFFSLFSQSTNIFFSSDSSLDLSLGFFETSIRRDSSFRDVADALAFHSSPSLVEEYSHSFSHSVFSSNPIFQFPPRLRHRMERTPIVPFYNFLDCSQGIHSTMNKPRPFLLFPFRVCELLSIFKFRAVESCNK